MRPLQPLVEIFRQPGGAGRALPERHKTHPASTVGGPRLVRRPLGIIHVTDVYVVFRLRRYKFWLSRAPGYLGTRDEKSGLVRAGPPRTRFSPKRHRFHPYEQADGGVDRGPGSAPQVPPNVFRPDPTNQFRPRHGSHARPTHGVSVPTPASPPAAWRTWRR